MYTSAQLSGFESTSNRNTYGSSEPGQQVAPALPHGASQPPSATTTTEPPRIPTEYHYKARAIYSYEANPNDVNEISFQKDEILEISDMSGRWWQARRANGDMGIAPSNYLQLEA